MTPGAVSPQSWLAMFAGWVPDEPVPHEEVAHSEFDEDVRAAVDQRFRPEPVSGQADAREEAA